VISDNACQGLTVGKELETVVVAADQEIEVFCNKIADQLLSGVVDFTY
jgi:hypothetical protein